MKQLRMKLLPGEDAVSPVIGVMLMLVVTIIIAAVVSGFAGGLTGSQAAAPQATIQAEYSQSQGMKICHTGGDVLKTKEIGITIRPSGDYAAGLEEWVTSVDKTLIENLEGTFWFDDSGAIRVPGFGPGDVAVISAENCKTEHLQPDIWRWAQDMWEATPSYPGKLPSPPAGGDFDNGICKPEFVGGSFYLDFYSGDGKLISSSKVIISP